MAYDEKEMKEMQKSYILNLSWKKKLCRNSSYTVF